MPTSTRLVLLLIVALSFAGAARAETHVILDVKPLSRVESNEDGTSRHILTPQERAEFRITVVEIDGRYYWANRQHREVLHTSSGAVHYFISPEGSGTLKVVDTHFLFHDPKDKSPRWAVVEQVGIITTTLTYWGKTNEFHEEYLE